jgi:hypothetical protein
MVCITALADGKWRTPPDGRVVPPYTTTREFYEPTDWKAGDIGLVRLTNGDYNDNDTRSSIYGGKSAYPFWKEPAAYFVSRPFSIALPAGRYRLAVAKGIEYLPVVEEFEIRAGDTKTRKVELERWVNMPEQGWYSGDDHIHYPRTEPEHDKFLLTWAEAEDIHVANILRMGDWKETFFEQSAYGRASHAQRGDHVLVTGQEGPRTDIAEQGHTIALNIQQPVRDTSRYHLYDYMFDGVHAQGGLTGYAHKSWAPEYYRRTRPELHPTWDSTINVPRGKIDFFELLQFRMLGLEDFYDFLNLGFKVTASAGSDLPWGSMLGEARVYAYTGRDFSADAWFAAVKKGHTFVSDGPMLSLQAGEAIPGDELRVDRNADVSVTVRAWAPPEIGAPKTLELISHGRVIESVESTDPSQTELRIDLKMQTGKSLWLAARTRSHKDGLAHTSALYILVDGESFADRTATAALVEKRLDILDFIEDRLADARLTRRFSEGEVDRLTAKVNEARGIYKALVSN